MLERSPLGAAVVYTVVGVLPMYLASAQAVALQRDLGFGPAQLGLIVSSFFLVSSIASKRVGPWLDHAGARRGLRISSALTAVTCTVIVIGVHRWETLAVLLGVVGLANAFGQVGSNLVIAHLVGAGRQGVAFSAKQSAIPTAALLAGVVVPVIGETGSWRWPYALVALAAAALFLACPRFPAAVSVAARQAGQRRLTPALAALMVAAMVGGGIGNSVAAFTADAGAAAGFTASVAGLLLTAGSATAIVVRIAAGLSVDRGAGTGGTQMAALLALGVVGLVTLATAGPSPVVFVAGLLLTFAGAWGWQGIAAYLALRTVDLPAATSTGAIWSAVYLGTVVMPAITGTAADRWSYGVVFAAMSMGMLLAVAALLTALGLARRGRG